MTEIIGYNESSLREATISTDELYRYQLQRDWTRGGQARRVCTFVMLNPSTADGKEDDPTIRRCIRFAHSFGCTALKVVNLFALRATDPRELLFQGSLGVDLNGPMNYNYLRLAIETSTHCQWPLVVAWGAFVDQLSMGKAQVGWVRRELLYQRGSASCLGKTASGQPKHPLYLKRSTELEVWR